MSEALTEQVQPPPPWYRRTDIVAVLVAFALGYAFLILGVDDSTRFRTRLSPAGDLDFDWMYFWHLIPLMWRGLMATVKATVFGFTFSVGLGLVLALLRRSTVRVVSWPTAFLIEFIRSTPILVQLYFLHALIRSLDWFRPSSISILAIGLGVHYATYCSEAYRAGINSVDKGQWEAATALNLGPLTKWRQVVLPQAIPNVLPALGNFLVAAFKDAPLGIAVNATGILFFAQAVRGGDFRAVEPYLMMGVGFLLASLPAAWLVRRLERKVHYERT
ncbi:MAG: ectoine/hydroxyectoine ABC transporter permease subunit EhuD [Acidimicrobiales bacterium]|nr:ectoine/hydroxyectoine ABC transporter permease subunit EhuD [Acidimicrobiales bacterium]